jgi:hypothetical protein
VVGVEVEMSEDWRWSRVIAATIALAVTILFAFIGGGVYGRNHYAFFGMPFVEARHEPAPAEASIDTTLVDRITTLEKQVNDMARIRAVNITADRLDVAIFPVERLGVVRVAKTVAVSHGSTRP